MSLRLQKIDVVVLFVQDLERAKAFYIETLGFQLAFQDGASAFFELEGASLLLLSVAGARELLSTEAVAVQRDGAVSQLVAFVDDVDAVHADLVAKGVEFIREPVDRAWGLRTAHFKDPDGNVWEISHSLPAESHEG